MSSPKTPVPSDLDIAQAATLEPIGAIAERMGLVEDDIDRHGDHLAKIKLSAIDRLADQPDAKYILVTAITPTPLGEGKTTTSVGLAQAMNRIGKRTSLAIRQPSMGPTFGIKGGAAGGGYSQVVPMEEFNLHLTGDIHAVTVANNLLSAMIDNHIYHGNALDIDPYSITWRRVMDVSDRALRNIVIGLGRKWDGPPRETGFDIAVASEVMAILALTSSLRDLRERMGRIVFAYDRSGKPVTADQLKAAGAMAVLMKDSLKPTLVQTLEGGPALVHAGPFANIAHGNSSIIADRIGIKAADYHITEAGFGADIGAEKFFNIKCRASGLKPDAAVLVTTVRAMKLHTGKYRVRPGKPLPPEMVMESPGDVAEGAANLKKQIENLAKHGVTPVVCINRFPTDHDSEIQAVHDAAAELGVRSAESNHWAAGGAGAEDLAKAVVEAADEPSTFSCLYELDQPVKDKIGTICREIYGADGVDFDMKAAKQIERYEAAGLGGLPICMAKTHLSISDDPKKLGAPSGFRVKVREVRASAGAGFLYPLLGDMRTMPGLPSRPAAENVDIDLETGQVVGLF